MIGNASGVGRSVSSSSHAIVDCQNHFDRRSILTLKFKCYKHFSDCWVINNWSQLFHSHQQNVLGVHRLRWLFSCTGLLAVRDKFVGREACFKAKAAGDGKVYMYDVYLDCWAVSFRLPFDNSSIAAIDSFPARCYLEWPKSWFFQEAYFFMCHFEYIF